MEKEKKPQGTQSIFVCMGASNHTDESREINDYYATQPFAVNLLLNEEKFNNKIWEPACGGGHISNVLLEKNYDVFSSDKFNRGFECEKIDFLNDVEPNSWVGDIITNPPYKLALEFTKKSLEVVKEGNKVAMFLKLTFLEGKRRKEFFKENPPKVVYVSSSRLSCAKGGEFEKYKGLNAIAYCWYIWEKGWKGDTIIKWIN